MGDWWIGVVTGAWEIMCSTSFGGDPGTGKGGLSLFGQGEGSWGWLGEMSVATRGRGRGVWATGGSEL